LTSTVFAGHCRTELDLGLSAKCGDLQIDFSGDEDVATAGRWAAALPEEARIAKDRPKQIVEAAHARKQISEVDHISAVV
jgi:hypothetical protein